jgi:tetratricopeptide (TPR) repeat protein
MFVPNARGVSRGMRTLLVIAMLSIAGAWPAAAQPPAASTAGGGGAIAPLLEGLGSLQHPVSTDVERAQRFFDQGMRLLYAFNFLEADRAFREAARLDPTLAMAHWGQAMALAPNINAPMTDEEGRTALTASRQAVELKAHASEPEQAYIDAMATRFSDNPTDERAALDRRYAEAMKTVAARYPDDPDAVTFAVAAFMQTTAWDYWNADGSPKPGVEEAKAALEGVLARHPDHPGANHYRIHLLEASDRHVGEAEASADRLRGAMPIAGHMVHMPSHIYLRVGRYADASQVNEDAILADEDYIAQCRAQGLYPVAYYPHNIHFLWAAATFEGRSEVAIDSARKVAAKVPHHLAGQLAWTHEFPVIPMFALVRFGQWSDILSEPKPHVDAPYPNAIWHYARALAKTARGDVGGAEVELAALETERKSPLFETTLKETPLASNLDLAIQEVRAEIAARRGDYATAIAAARKGVELQDAQAYNEPELWHRPVRLVLGAILLDANRPAEAEAVYREDLERHRETGWALVGLLDSLRRQGKTDEAGAVAARFRQAWARADVEITASRFGGD